MADNEIKILDINGLLKHTFIGSSLKGANLQGLDLAWADFRGKDLRGTDFSDSNLSRSTFDSANLEGASFNSTTFKLGSFQGANLHEASFSNTKLYGVDFTEADLTNSYFGSIEFLYAIFKKAKMDGATLTKSIFKFCTDISESTGISDTRIYDLALDRSTIIYNVAGLPDEFLKKTGYSQREIDVLRELYRENRFFSCFISHAEQNLDFAEKLIGDLESQDISCWHYKKDLKGGDDWFPQIERGIEGHDKLIVVLSKDSVCRENVVAEIVKAIELEEITNIKRLFPIRLDNFILSKEMMEIAKENVRTGLWSRNWVSFVRKRHIPDFLDWTSNPGKYKDESDKLVAALVIPE